MLDRFKYSTIAIGDDCSFISNIYCNQLLTSRCVVRTSNANASILIGDRSGFSGVRIIADKSIRIGRRVIIGANTIIRDGDDHPERLGTEPEEIVIEDNVFIGMNCTILKGVTIGKGAIIGAGSIVTKDIPAGAKAAGVPCRVLSHASDSE